MASQNQRTVTLTLNANTTGTDGVKTLADELLKLGKKSGEASPEFEKLSKELNNIAAQQEAVTTFEALNSALGDSATAIVNSRKALTTESDALAIVTAELKQASVAEADHAAKVRAASTTLQEAKKALLDARAATSAYTAEIGGAKTATKAQAENLKTLNQATREAKAAQDSARAAVAELVPEYERLKSATSGAAQAVKEQDKEMGKASTSAKAAKEEYDQLNAALVKVTGEMVSLGVDTRNVIGEQNRLSQSMASLIGEADRLKAALAAPAQAAMTAAQKIEQAFGVTGVKSTNAVKAEILKVNTALMALAKDSTITGEDFDRAFSAGKAKIAALEAQLHGATAATKSMGSGIAGAFKAFGSASFVFNAVSAGINAITGAAAKIPEVTAQFQTISRTLTILTGDTNKAAKEFDYIKTVANRTGTDIKGMADSYIRLAAATKNTGLEGAQTKRIFEAISGSMGVLGASSSETENALMAVSQMVSKGVVSMEEMRQQLGERLPGAFQVTAKELGITTAELNDLISSGSLAADDVLPAMARGLEAMYKSGSQNDTLIGKWRQFTNALKESGNAIGDSGLLDGLLKTARVGAGVVTVLTEGFLAVGKSVGLAAAAIRTGDIRGALAAMAAEFAKVDEHAKKVAGASSVAKKSLAELAAEADKAGQAFFTGADGAQYMTKEVIGANTGFIAFLTQSNKAIKSAEDFSTSARKSAEATRAAGEAAITSANALGSEADKRATATKVANDNAAALSNVLEKENRVLALQKEQAMRRAEEIRDGTATSDAHKKQLNDLGEEIGKREAVVNGLKMQVEANRLLGIAMATEAEANNVNETRVVELTGKYSELTATLAVVREAVAMGWMEQEKANAVDEQAKVVKKLLTDALKDEAFATEAIAKIIGNEKGIRDAAIKSTENHLAMLKLVGEERTDEYRKTELQLVQMQTERVALDDHSKSLGAYREAARAASEKVKELTDAKAAGKDVAIELRDAEIEEAKAKALYKDAINDQIASLKALEAAKKGEYDVASAKVKLAIEEKKSIIDIAKAKGDEKTATEALVAQKRLEIELSELMAKAKRAEADAALLLVKAEREQAIASDTLTPIKEAELKAHEAAAQVKKIEAQIAEETADRMRKLTDTIAQNAKEADNSVSSYNDMADALDSVSNSANRAGRAIKSVRYDKNGMALNTNGDVISAATGKQAWTEWGASELDDFINGRSQVKGNPEAIAAAQAEVQRRVDAANAQATEQISAKRTADTAKNTPQVGTNFTIASTGTPGAIANTAGFQIQQQAGIAPQRTTTVNVNIAGRSTAVNTASDADANALLSVIKQLETAANRSY